MRQSWTCLAIFFVVMGTTIWFYRSFLGLKKPHARCLEGCHQTDERLVDLIKEKFLQPPSDLAYNFDQSPPPFNGQFGQPAIVDKLLGRQRSGFFIECGAHSGESLSNSLFFEMERNWTGLLVEPNPEVFLQLIGKNRKAYSLNACLSIREKSGKEEFLLAGTVGGIVGMPENEYLMRMRNIFGRKKTLVQCFPTYSVLLALGNPVIDYFSLDVEGAEMGILKTIPWDKVRIRVMTIEYNADETVKKEMIDFMSSKGYEMVQVVKEQDLVFVLNK